MRFQFFRIPASEAGAYVEAFNTFLASNPVSAIDRHFVDLGENSYWAFAVTVTEASGAQKAGDRNKPRVDYREVLSKEDFAVYAALRNVRKDLASKDGIPAYYVFGNEQLAAMVTGRVTTMQGIEAIPGVGPAKATRYAAPMLEVLRQKVPALPTKLETTPAKASDSA